MNSFIIKGDICYSADKNTILTYENSYAVCVDGISRGVYPVIPEEYRALPIHDYSGMLVMPGMVDLHIHAPQYAYRGMGMDKELLEWLNSYAFPEEAKYADLSYAESAYSIFADAIKNSATTRLCVFGTKHTEATKLLMDQLDAAGVCSYVGRVNMDRNAPDDLREPSAEYAIAETERFITETQGRYRRTRPIITPRFVPSCSDKAMEGLGRLAAKYNAPVQSHLSENPDEVAWVKELCPDADSYGDAYDRYGLFGRPTKTVMAHCVWSDERETELMKRNGVYIAHCPASNMNVASGIAPIRRYLDMDMNVGLGSDVAGGHSESIFAAMREAIQVSKLYKRLVDADAKPLDIAQAFYMATLGGGSFFGRVGSFKPGYAFDAAVIDDSLLPHPQPLTLIERLERAVYLGGDIKALRGKYCEGEKLMVNIEN